MSTACGLQMLGASFESAQDRGTWRLDVSRLEVSRLEVSRFEDSYEARCLRQGERREHDLSKFRNWRVRSSRRQACRRRSASSAS